MSGAYTTTVWIERTIEIEVEVRVVPDEPDTRDALGGAGEVYIQDAWIDPSGGGRHPHLSDEERAEVVEKAKQQGPPDEAPDCGPPALRR